MTTEWRPVEGYEDCYEVSRSGLVRSVPRDFGYGVIDKPKLLAFDPDRGGYLRVRLCKDGKKRGWFVHRLVAQAFVPNPDGKPFVNHIDEDRTNNHASNLEWVYTCENNAYGNRNERIAKGVSRQIEQIDPETMQVIRVWDSATQAARALGCSNSLISGVTTGKRETALGFIWRKVRD